MHVIPNGEIKVVSNPTRGWSRAVVDVGVAYEEDVDRALAVVRDEAAQFSTDKAWSSQLDGARRGARVSRPLGDSAVQIRTLHSDPAGVAVERGARVPAPAQEPVRPRGNRDSVPAAQRSASRSRESCPSQDVDLRWPARAADDAPPLQHADPQGRAVRAAPAGPGVALHLRPHGLQLRPHRKFPHVPVRGPPAPLARGQRLRGLPHHEPHRRGRPDHRRGAPEGRLRCGRTWTPFARAFDEDRDWLRIRPAARAAAGHRVHRADDPAGRRPAAKGGGLQGRRRLGLLRDRASSRRTAGSRSSTGASSRPAPASGSATTSTPRRTPATSCSGRRPDRRTRRWARPGMRRSAGAGPAGTSSARRWRSS